MNLLYLKKEMKSQQNTLAVKKKLRPRTKKRPGVKRCEIKMGGQGQWSVTADGNKILIITIQAAKHSSDHN